MSIKDSIIDNFRKPNPVEEVTVDIVIKAPSMAEWSKRIKDLGKSKPIGDVDFSGVRVKGKPISDVDLRKMPLVNGSLRDFDEYSKTIPSDRVRPEPVLRPITTATWIDMDGKEWEFS